MVFRTAQTGKMDFFKALANKAQKMFPLMTNSGHSVLARAIEPSEKGVCNLVQMCLFGRLLRMCNYRLAFSTLIEVPLFHADESAKSVFSKPRKMFGVGTAIVSLQRN